jgi:hypothetical protein
MAKRGRIAASVALITVLTLVASTVSIAHPEKDRAEDMFGDVAPAGHDKEHEGSPGHLDPINQNVRVVGKAEVSQRGGGGPPARGAPRGGPPPRPRPPPD